MLRCIGGAAYFLCECPRDRHKNRPPSCDWRKFGGGVAEKARFCTAAQLFSNLGLISLASMSCGVGLAAPKGQPAASAGGGTKRTMQ
jgi:hypothetical protein